MNYNSIMKQNYETPCTKGYSLVPRKIVCTSPELENNTTVNDYTNHFGEEQDWDN